MRKGKVFLFQLLIPHNNKVFKTMDDNKGISQVITHDGGACVVVIQKEGT